MDADYGESGWTITTEEGYQPMAISKDQYAKGISVDEFINDMQVNKEKFVENIDAFTVTDEDRAFFDANPVSIAAFGEDWCTDVIQFLPVVAKLARELSSVDVRVFKRDENLDLMQPYLKEGKYQSIPVFVVHDADWNELGHFIERPAAVTAQMATETLRFAKENPHLEGVNRTYEHMSEETRQAVRANSSNFRWSNMDAWNRIFIDDLKALITSGATADAAADD